MQATRRTVNQKGLQEIQEFLRKTLAGYENRTFSTDELLAWAYEAEFQLREGNPASIEIKHYSSEGGYTRQFTISDEGLDSFEVEIEE